MLHILRVFVGDDAEHGNPLGVFLNGARVPPSRRQHVAADLGFSETVYVDDPQRGELRIFTPAVELPMAGHPLVGTAWLMWHEGLNVTELRPPAGAVAVRRAGEHVWIRARPEWAPDFELRQLPVAQDVGAHPGAGPDEGLLVLWAWQDERRGELRARVFTRALGIEEDEATGAAALRLASHLGRPLTITQGRGSLLLARPAAGEAVEVGGRVVLDQKRLYPL